MVKETYEDGATVSYLYDNDGALSKVIDSVTGITTTYYYDFSGRLMKYTEIGIDYSHSVSYTYSDTGNLLSQSETVNGVTTTYSYTYDDQSRVSSMTVGNITVQYAYDIFGRKTQQTVYSGSNVIQSNSISYVESGSSTSSQVSSYNGVSYRYDDNGNICEVGDGQSEYTLYMYDSQNQLVRTDNSTEGYIHTFSYDSAGNILSRKEYAFADYTLQSPLKTVNYTYADSEWGDLLTAYNGKAITYDSIGNPLTYDGWTFNWEHGRQLKSMTKGNTTWTYTYDANGMRTGRTNGLESYEYVYNGGLLTQMKYSGQENLTFDFTYDANGTPLTISVGDYVYYYITNLQGDVIGILNQYGD